MERELERARRMEALGQLTGGVAHEFNNMLAIILGHAGLLRARLGSGVEPRLADYLDHIEQAGSRAKDLIRQMLIFSRPQDSRPERIALKPAVRESITLARGSLPSSIEIDYSPRSGLPDVHLDMGELQQLLTNLLINARDAMGGKGRIGVAVDLFRGEGGECQHCHARVNGEWVQLSVEDNGHGIARDDLARIFEPFFSTKAVGEGTGLGLSVVQGIVERNNGHILVDSEPGAGTRFRLLFPPVHWEREVPAVPTLGPPGGGRAAGPGPGGGRRARVDRADAGTAPGAGPGGDRLQRQPRGPGVVACRKTPVRPVDHRPDHARPAGHRAGPPREGAPAPAQDHSLYRPQRTGGCRQCGREGNRSLLPQARRAGAAVAGRRTITDVNMTATPNLWGKTR
jgi:hypothetical protein